MQPLAFAILRALTPPDVEVISYDERVESTPLDEPTDLVAMTVETYTARRAFQLSTGGAPLRSKIRNQQSAICNYQSPSCFVNFTTRLRDNGCTQSKNPPACCPSL